MQKGREASGALQRLRETAPTFAVRAQDALREGQFGEALKAATFALKLESQSGEYYAFRERVLQVLVRWPEALLSKVKIFRGLLTCSVVSASPQVCSLISGSVVVRFSLLGKSYGRGA